MVNARIFRGRVFSAFHGRQRALVRASAATILLPIDGTEHMPPFVEFKT
jgi:hypothetical protein